MKAPAWPRLGLRSEVLIVFPVAVLLLVVIATFTVFAYRDALERIVDERREEAARVARRAAEALDRWAPGEPPELRSLPLEAEALTVYDPEGRLLLHLGAGVTPPAALSGPVRAPHVEGPSSDSAGRIVAFAPAGGRGGRSTVRVEIDAAAEWAAGKSIRVLVPFVLGIGGGVVLLVILFLGRLLRPYDRMIVSARAAGLLKPGDPDEIASLVSGFQRAIDTGRTPEEPIEAVERALGSGLEAGLLLLDAEGRLLGLNPEGSRLLGVEPPPPGAPLGELLRGLPDLAALLDDAIASASPIERTEVSLRRGGETSTLGLAFHPLRRQDGSPRGFLALFSDQTRLEQLAAERRMAEGLTQLGELSAGVAHELRNSLGVLRGYLDLLRDETNPGLVADYRDEIARETDRLQGVVDDFLTFARPGASRLENLDLGELVGRVANDPALAGHAVRTVVPATGPPPLPGDRVLLERALRNLVRNAAEAHPQGRAEDPITLSVSPTDGGWAIVVEDRGPGLPAEVRARLFQPFVSGRPGGTGLGLALSFRIVSLHSGALEIEDRPGGGTRAKISFRSDAFATNGSNATPELRTKPAGPSA